MNNSGIIIDNVKYIRLYNDNEFKKNSLNDNVYFTLRDIFLNAYSYTAMMSANYFNQELSGGVRFEERNEKFRYMNVLNNKDYVKRLYKWLCKFDNSYYFDFHEPEEHEPKTIEDVDEKAFIKFDDWFVQLEELKRLLSEKIKQFKEPYVP